MDWGLLLSESEDKEREREREREKKREKEKDEEKKNEDGSFPFALPDLREIVERDWSDGRRSDAAGAGGAGGDRRMGWAADPGLEQGGMDGHAGPRR